MLLTGTPLQNTVEELFSLLHFLEPAQFPSETEFLRDFGDLKTEEQVCPHTHTRTYVRSHTSGAHAWLTGVPQVQKLQAILKPMMLRRLKEDVEKNLAPKQETIIEVRSHTQSFQRKGLCSASKRAAVRMSSACKSLFPDWQILLQFTPPLTSTKSLFRLRRANLP